MNMILFSDQAGEGMASITKILGFLGDNLGTIVDWVVRLTGAFLLYKAAMLVVNGSIAAYNIVLGISVALGKSSIFAMRGNTAAAWAFSIAQKVIIAGTWLWNGALTAFVFAQGLASTAMAAFNAVLIANPIGAVIAAIVLMIALIAAAVTHYDDWGAAVLFLLGPIGLLVNIVMALKNNWDSITKAFKEDGIIAGMKRIGVVLLDAILFPMQQLLELMSSIPLIGDLAGEGATRIAEIRESLDLVNPEADKQEANVSREESIEKQQLEILINNKSDNSVESSSSNFAPQFTPTFGG
jgi:hypothetical protein